MMGGMSSLVELAHMLDSEVSKASSEDGRFIRAGENDKWVRSKGERQAAYHGQATGSLKGLPIGAAAGAALGAGALAASRGKLARSARKNGDAVTATALEATPRRRLAATGAIGGGIAGGAVGGVAGSAMGEHKEANRWRKAEGLSPRSPWTGFPRE